MSSAQSPFAGGPPPVRTQFDSPKDPQGSGISWPWLKWLQSIFSFLANLSFSNIAGKIDIDQINTSNAPAPGLFLDGNATWSAGGGGGGGVSSVGLTGDGVVFKPAVTNSPITSSGNLVPVLEDYPAGYFIASPASAAGTLIARKLTPADIGSVIKSGSVVVDFGSGDTTTSALVLAPWVTANSVIICTVTGGTADHPEMDQDAIVEDIIASVWDIVPGSSFMVGAYAPNFTFGQYIVSYLGVA